MKDNRIGLIPSGDIHNTQQVGSTEPRRPGLQSQCWNRTPSLFWPGVNPSVAVKGRPKGPRESRGVQGKAGGTGGLVEVFEQLAHHAGLPWLRGPVGTPVSTALATALDVGLSNWSFLYITVSL